MASLLVIASWLILAGACAAMLFVTLARIPEAVRQLLVAAAVRPLAVVLIQMQRGGGSAETVAPDPWDRCSEPTLARRRLLVCSFERWVVA